LLLQKTTSRSNKIKLKLVKEDLFDVVQTAEDYIWFKLGQVKTYIDGQELPMDMLTYNHLQSLISLEYGVFLI